MRKFIVFLFVLITAKTAIAQTSYTAEDILQMSYEELYSLPLEELMELADIVGVATEKLLSMILARDISVSTKDNETLRDAPGIISVITAGDIEQSGARDLWDVLYLVPGFVPSYDVVGTYSLGVRGLMGQSRILILKDGQMTNELMYNTIQLNNHYNLENIKQVEIIRGPGSSVYGGNAVLAVINIVTKKGKDINGIAASASYSRMKNTYGRKNYSLSLGKHFKDLDIVWHSFLGKSIAADNKYTNLFGETYNMANGSEKIKTRFSKLAVSYKGLKVNASIDDYTTSTIDFYNYIYTPPFDVRFRRLLGQIKYDINVNEQLTITPEFDYSFFMPWQTIDNRYTYHHSARQLSFLTNFVYKYKQLLHLSGGIEYVNDKSKLLDKTEPVMYAYYNNSKSLSFNNFSAYFQSIIHSSLVNITIGARLDNHSAYKSAFSPRVGITRVFHKLHAKLLFGRAFRSPGIENMNHAYLKTPEGTPVLNAPVIKPEIANSVEFEVGYKFSDNLFARFNLFDMQIRKSIVYFVYYIDNVNYVDGYYNAGKTGSSGIEADILYVRDKMKIRFNYSFYTALNKNEVDVYGIYDSNGNTMDKNMLIGTPQHKFVFRSHLQLSPNISFNPSLIFSSGSYAYTNVDEWYDELPPQKQDNIWLLNASLNYQNVLIKNLTLNISVHDLLNYSPELYPLYRGYHAPYPGRSREISAKLTYHFKMK